MGKGKKQGPKAPAPVKKPPQQVKPGRRIHGFQKSRDGVIPDEQDSLPPPKPKPKPESDDD